MQPIIKKRRLSFRFTAMSVNPQRRNIAVKADNDILKKYEKTNRKIQQTGAEDFVEKGEDSLRLSLPTVPRLSPGS